MNRMNGAFAIALCNVALVLAAPGYVRLSGVVSKTGGKTLPGVVISLAKAPTITATSGSDGTFQLKAGTTGVGERVSEAAPTFSIRERFLEVSSMTESVSWTVDVLAADGRRTFSGGIAAGASLRLGPDDFAPGLSFVSVRSADAVHARAVLRVADRLLPATGAVGEVVGIASRDVAAAVDTIVAKKTGFVDRKAPIASYVDSTLVLSMDSAVSGVCTPPKAGTSKSNPIFTDVYTADPAAMVDNCTFYIVCGHDQGVGGFDLREWYLLKSADMVNWTRTTPMTLKTFSWTNANAWAGQMIHAKNGKYYWYVPINDVVFSQDRMAIGVAVADKPEGPWKDALGKPLINDSLEMATWGITNIDQTPHTIDPTVFIDDDGQAYLQYGGFWRMITVKLDPDMVTISGKLTETTPADYFESPYLIKRNGVYYEIYAHGSANPTTIDYATAKSPMGPWTHKGTILDAMPKVSGQDESTNHAGVAEFAGQWYIVYHVSNGPNNGGAYRREVAIDKLVFNADGTIQKVVPGSALTF